MPLSSPQSTPPPHPPPSPTVHAPSVPLRAHVWTRSRADASVLTAAETRTAASSVARPVSVAPLPPLLVCDRPTKTYRETRPRHWPRSRQGRRSCDKRPGPCQGRPSSRQSPARAAAMPELLQCRRPSSFSQGAPSVACVHADAPGSSLARITLPSVVAARSSLAPAKATQRSAASCRTTVLASDVPVRNVGRPHVRRALFGVEREDGEADDLVGHGHGQDVGPQDRERRQRDTWRECVATHAGRAISTGVCACCRTASPYRWPRR